jgi:hypothetical protein
MHADRLEHLVDGDEAAGLALIQGGADEGDRMEDVGPVTGVADHPVFHDHEGAGPGQDAGLQPEGLEQAQLTPETDLGRVHHGHPALAQDGAPEP